MHYKNKLIKYIVHLCLCKFPLLILGQNKNQLNVQTVLQMKSITLQTCPQVILVISTTPNELCNTIFLHMSIKVYKVQSTRSVSPRTDQVIFYIHFPFYYWLTTPKAHLQRMMIYNLITSSLYPLQCN